jgi:hypothetical protein
MHASRPADVVLIAAIGFILLAALPGMLELVERRMGARGGVATGILLLAGNAGGLIVAVIVDVAVNSPPVAFLILAAVAIGGLPAARRLAAAT